MSSFSWLDLAALDSLEEEAREVFGLDKEGDYLSFVRIEAICLALRERVKRLKGFIAKHGGIKGSVKQSEPNSPFLAKRTAN